MSQAEVNELIKYLSVKTKTKLIEEIKELFISHKVVEDYYTKKISILNEEEKAKLLTTIHIDEDKLWNDNYNIIKNEFAKNPENIVFTFYKNLLKEYSSISKRSDKITDLMLILLELYIEHGVKYGFDRNYFNKVSIYYKRTLKFIIEKGLNRMFQDRIKEIIDKSSSEYPEFEAYLYQAYDEYLISQKD